MRSRPPRAPTRRPGSEPGRPRRTPAADALAARCEAVTTPLLVRRSASAGLTAREEEVARLAASGLSDAVIAARLDVSVRTVETHLHRAYTKLGVAGRQDLLAALGT